MSDEQTGQQVAGLIEDTEKKSSSIKIKGPTMTPKVRPPYVPTMKPGTTYMIEITKPVTVIQAAKPEAKEFDLTPKAVYLGEFKHTTVAGRDSFFFIEEFEDEVALPPGTFRVEE